MKSILVAPEVYIPQDIRVNGRIRLTFFANPARAAFLGAVLAVFAILTGVARIRPGARSPKFRQSRNQTQNHREQGNLNDKRQKFVFWHQRFLRLQFYVDLRYPDRLIALR
jgi:hypothetical protein